MATRTYDEEKEYDENYRIIDIEGTYYSEEQLKRKEELEQKESNEKYYFDKNCEYYELNGLTINELKQKYINDIDDIQSNAQNDYEHLKSEYNSLLNDYYELEKSSENYKYMYENLEQVNYLSESNVKETSTENSFFIIICIILIFIIMYFTLKPLLNKKKNY